MPTAKNRIMRPVHFEIDAKDPVKLADFYKKVFRWSPKTWKGSNILYVLVKTGKSKFGIDGAFSQDDGKPWQKVVNTINVSDIDDILEKIRKSGGKSLTDKQLIPKVGWHAYAADPEGIIFGVLQPDMKGMKM